MISTATAAVKAKVAPAPLPSQKPRVPTARAITTGTKTALTRSASRCTGALPDCASVTRRAICASAVSSPTRVARTTRRPPTLIVAPTTSSPGPDLDRHRLAGDQRLVDRRGAALDDAVGRDLLPGPDDEAVADARAPRSATRRSLPSASSRATSLAPRSSSASQRRAGPALGALLEVAAGEDEGGDDGGDLEVDLVGAGAALGDQLERHLHPVHPGVAEEQRVQRPAERGQGPDRDQGVHRRRAVAQVLPGGLVEGPARPEHHGRRQQQREPLPVVELQRLDHRQQQHRQRESGGEDQPPAQVRGRVGLPPSRPPPSARRQRSRVAGLLHRAEQLLGLRPARGRTRRVARSVAKLTVASTPSSLLRLFSTRPAQEEQVIPSIGSSSRSSVAGRFFRYPIGV